LVKWIFTKGLRTRLSVVRQPSEKEFKTSGYGPDLVQISVPTQSRTEQDGYDVLIDTMNSAFESALTELEKPEYTIDLRNSLNICELHFEEPVFTACCGIGSNHVVIQDDGKLASCPMTIRETNVIPTDDLLTSIRHTFKHSPSIRNNSTEPNCLDCRWFPVCVSGCPVNNERQKGTPFTISPLHGFYDFIIPRFVTFFGRKLYQASLRTNSPSPILSVTTIESTRESTKPEEVNCDG
jgi:radical SAM protein with 4Fe4S-binding SPASM domain